MYNLCIHNNAVCSSNCGVVCSGNCNSECSTQTGGCPQNCNNYTWMYSVYEENGVGYTNKCARDENCTYNEDGTATCPQNSHFNTGYNSITGSYYSSYSGNTSYCSNLSNGCPTYCNSDSNCICVRDCDSDCGNYCYNAGVCSNLGSYGVLGNLNDYSNL